MKSIILGFLILFLVSSIAFSDMGAILPNGKVDLTEPAQRAIIAHDGFTEILILSTDFEASQNTKVVRFIPFPSEVKVKKGNKDTFKALNELIKKYDISYLKFLKGGPPKKEGIEIISNQTLGPHKVIQVKVYNKDDFFRWVQKLFKEEELSKTGFGTKEENIVEHYLSKGISYFVFDIVDLSEGVNPVTPFVYEFNTRYFYYPLITSSIFSGIGNIELFVFSDRGEILEKLSYFPMPYPWKRSETKIVTWEDMEKISPHIARLMGEHAIFGVFKYYGTYDIKDDIWFLIPSYELKPYYPTRKR